MIAIEPIPATFKKLEARVEQHSSCLPARRYRTLLLNFAMGPPASTVSSALSLDSPASEVPTAKLQEDLGVRTCCWGIRE